MDYQERKEERKKKKERKEKKAERNPPCPPARPGTTSALLTVSVHPAAGTQSVCDHGVWQRNDGRNEQSSQSFQILEHSGVCLLGLPGPISPLLSFLRKICSLRSVPRGSGSMVAASPEEFQPSLHPELQPRPCKKLRGYAAERSRKVRPSLGLCP